MKQTAFTLIEYLCVLMISGILFFFIVHFDDKRRARSVLSLTRNELLSALDYGKTLALIRDQSLELLPLDGSDWSSGLLLFSDKNHNHRIDPSDTLYHQWVFQGRVRVRWQGFISSKYLRFSADLRSNASSGRFILNHSSLPDKSEEIIINRSGRARFLER